MSSIPSLWKRLERSLFTWPLMRWGAWQGAGALAPEGARVLRSYDGCGRRGDVGRLTFSVWSPSSPVKLLVCGTVDTVIVLPGTSILRCGKIGLHLIVSPAKRALTPCATCYFPSSPSPTASRFFTVSRGNAATAVSAAVKTTELHLVFLIN